MTIRRTSIPAGSRELAIERALVVVLVVLCSLTLDACRESETPEDRAAALLEELGNPQASPQHLGVLLDGPTPSISVAIAAQGEIVFSKAVGSADLAHRVPATPSTVYNIGSVSKVITAVAVMQLVEQGLVDLDDPIQTHVSWFPDKAAPISVWHLMTHTSGIRHYLDNDFSNTPDGENVMPVASLQEAVAVFKDDPLLFSPGDYYLYSSYVVNLLQGVVESASGMTFENYLSERVWGPARMTRTGLDIAERIVPGRARGYQQSDGQFTDYPYRDLTYKFPSGGMISTAEDLVRFALAVTRGELSGPETVERMFTAQLDDGVVSFDDRGPLRWQQLLMWRVRVDEAGRPYVHHCGTVAGFNACLIIYRDDDLIVAVIDNAASTDLSTARAFTSLFRNE